MLISDKIFFNEYKILNFLTLNILAFFNENLFYIKWKKVLDFINHV